MKSRTSFSKSAALRKDIIRFAPLWGLYLIGGLLVVMTMVRSEWDYRTAEYLSETLGIFAIINMLYAALCALMLFGDLYKSRLCNALHAMPPRREHWFLIHIAAGLLFSLVPNTIGVLCLLPSLGRCWAVGLWWLLGMELQFLFFFGLAVFCCMCAGNRTGAAVSYGMINFAAPIAAWVIDAIYIPMLPGVVVNTESFSLFCPADHLVKFTYFDEIIAPWNRFSGMVETTCVPSGSGWRYMAVLAALGVVFMVVALLLYRRRKLEVAGDFVGVRWLSPVFSFVYTAFVGALFAMFGTVLGRNYLPFLFIGVAVGYFTGQMLLRRTVKVFQFKTFLRYACITAVVALSLAVVRYDFFGIASWTPKASQVESVTVSTWYTERAVVTDTEDIEKLTQIHETLMGMDEPANGQTGIKINLRYKMKTGTVAIREYYVAQNDEMDPLRMLLSQPAYVLHWQNDPEELYSRLSGIRVDNKYVPKALRNSLLEAILTDCQAGEMAQVAQFNMVSVYELEVEYKLDNGVYRWVTVKVYANSANTYRWLLEHRAELGLP